MKFVFDDLSIYKLEIRNVSNKLKEDGQVKADIPSLEMAKDL